MEVLAIIIVGAVLAPVAFLICAHLRVSKVVRTTLSPDGCQEASIIVDQGYKPTAIEATVGIPLRLRFRRKEDAPCSDRVVFASIGVDRRLIPFQETLVEFVPATVGSFMFTCQWGMYRGKLMVTEPEARTKRLPMTFIARREHKHRQS